MSRHSIDVKQLCSESGQAYINVLNGCSGAIDLHGNTFNSPTYLLITDCTYRFVIFTSDAWRDEWMSVNRKYYDVVYRICDGSIIEEE